MRLALISDIHGNLVALEAVLAEIAQQNIAHDSQHILCLGDVAAFGPQPLQVLARLQGIGCPVVMGNTDAGLLNPLLQQPATEPTDRVQDIQRWCAQQLTEADKAYISSFQPTISYPLTDGKTLLAYHGSPRSFRERLLPTTTEEDLEQAFAGHSAYVMVGGHTHMQMFRRHKDMLVLNPGSVGVAMDRVSPLAEVHNPAWAEYAILTIEGNALNVELRRTPFDMHALHQAIYSSGIPHAEWLASEWTTV
jgi:predicted phosphodiesterase